MCSHHNLDIWYANPLVGISFVAYTLVDPPTCTGIPVFIPPPLTDAPQTPGAPGKMLLIGVLVNIC